MQLNLFAVFVLLGLSRLIGVSETPTDLSETWHIIQNWHHEHGISSLVAESSEIAKRCAAQNESVIEFPQVIHGAHEIFVGTRKILSFGDPTFRTYRSFYGAPVLKCRDITDASVITWKVYSYTQYFARFGRFPHVVGKRPLGNVISETMNTVAVGSLVATTILAMIVFIGKVEAPLVASIAFSGLLLATYFALASGEFFHIGLSMLTAHKFADLGVIGGFACFFNGLRLGGIIRSAHFWTYLATLALAMFVIAVANTGDSIQLGTSLAFGPTIAIIITGAWSQLTSFVNQGKDRGKIFSFLSLGLFLLGFLNEIALVTGVLPSYTVANICCIFGFMFYAFTVNERIVHTYQERDYLRNNLELEVARKTVELETLLNQLKDTQADLVQSAKLASLGTLSAGIAHEINNSLNYVNGAIKPIEKLLNGVDLGPVRTKIDTLFKAANEGLALTFSIIKSLRNYTGLNQAKLNDILVYDTIESVLKLIHSKMRHIEVVIDIKRDLQLYGSVVGLNQIFMNLIGNAVDAMDGKGRITISAADTGDTTIVSITDTGNGMSEEVKTRIFEPFFTTKDVGKGTGLGLHIVQTEMRRHHGRVHVESEIGKGTTFLLEFPKASATSEDRRAA